MMTITELQQRYATHPNVEAISGLLKNPSVRTLFCGGLCASAASLFSSVLVQRGEFPFVFILGDLEEAGYFYHDLTQVLGTDKVLFFPSSFRRAIKYGQKDAANEILRTEVLSRLQKGEEGLCVVTYPDALAEKVVSRKELEDKTQLAGMLRDEYRREFFGEGQLFFYYKRLRVSKKAKYPLVESDI